ncbi:MAG: restriction endonuclease [Chloroflexota bacterium]|nr:restriction endonuclease [Chloroflexota bacterium]
MQELLKLSPSDFEMWTVDYLRSRGFNSVVRVGGAGDLGVDVRCRNDLGEITVVQCKRYSPDNKVGSKDIQHFFAMMIHHNAVHGIFVTTSSYTRGARELALARKIELVNGAQLVESLNRQNQERLGQEQAIDAKRKARQGEMTEEYNRRRREHLLDRQRIAQLDAQRIVRLEEQKRRKEEHRDEHVNGNLAEDLLRVVAAGDKPKEEPRPLIKRMMEEKEERQRFSSHPHDSGSSHRFMKPGTIVLLIGLTLLLIVFLRS